MDSSRNAEAIGETSDDLSALAWVHDELRRSLEAAHKALRRFVKESEAAVGADVDAVDPAVLRNARQQLHQGVGALELVGLPAAAAVLQACEAAIQRYVAKPHKLTSKVVDDIEHASFALLDYVSRMLAGKAVSALSLFPQYRAVQEAAGAERVHPADLWTVDWRWRDLHGTGLEGSQRQPDAATRLEMEQQMLVLMRKPTTAAAAQMSDICDGLGAGATHLQTATLWKLAAAVFEAQAQGLLQFDVFSKRVAARLLAQLRVIERGDADVSERLAQDLLFFCAQAASPGDGRKAPRLAAVRQAYGLAHHTPVDYSISSLGRFDPALIAQARKRVLAAKESWSAVAGGEMHRMSGLAEQFSLVGDSLRRLFPSGDAMAAELQNAVALTQQGGVAPNAPLAMEVATGMLYVEASLEDGDFDDPELGDRIRRLAERIAAVRQGAAPEPLESWMEDLYRRVSDRQTMGSVVQELRASLSEAEKLIDQFFRNPADRQVLIPVPNQLSAMRGVLSVLGMDQASMALLRMRDEVDGLISTEIEQERVLDAGVFERLAGNLGALGFLIDMLSVQPQMAKSLFVYDPETGTFSPVMGRNEQRAAFDQAPSPVPPIEPRLIEQAQLLAFTAIREDISVEEVSRDLVRLSHEAQAADQPELAATVSNAHAALERAHGDQDNIASVRGQLSEALVDFVSTAFEPVGVAPEPAATRAQDSAPLPVAGFTIDLAEDDEMREIFLEEAREVLQGARDACVELANVGDDLTQLTTVRRAFHTLKGSSRMVGLSAFGDAAWACEQLYNTRLADQQGADTALLTFTGWALEHLTHWVDDIAARRDAERDARQMEAAVLALREPAAPAPFETLEPAPDDHATEPSLPMVAQVSAPAPSAPMPLWNLPPGFPTAQDLDLGASAERPHEAASPEHGVSFELDLSALDMSSVPPQVPASALPEFEHFDPTNDGSASLEKAEPVHGIDLDLGDDSFDSAPLIENLQPSSELPAAAPVPVEEAPTSPTVESVPESEITPPAFAEEEQVKVVGPLRISIPLFNIFLNEADELSRRLTTEVAEWAMELHRPVGETPIALAHSLAGSSATVGFSDLSHLARMLEHALMRTEAIGRGTPEEGRLFVDAAEEVRRLLHQFAAGFLKEPLPHLMQRLADHEVSSAHRLDAVTAAAERSDSLAPTEFMPASESIEAGEVHELIDVPLDFDVTEGVDLPLVVEPVADALEPPAAIEAETPVTDTRPGQLAPAEPESLPVHPLREAAAGTGFGELESRFDALSFAEFKPFTALPADAVHVEATHHRDIDDDIDAIDAVDADLFPIFEEEAQDLLPLLASQLRSWAHRSTESAHAAACMRTLHTLKGGARLAGAMRLGEMAHRLETRIEHLLAQADANPRDIEALHGLSDALMQTFEALRSRDAQADVEAVAQVNGAAGQAPEAPLVDEAQPAIEPEAQAPAEEPPAAEAISQPVPKQPAPLTPLAQAEIDWSRFSGESAAPRATADRATQASQSAVRVRAPVLDRLVNQAGEVSIARSRIEVEVNQIKASLTDLTDNLDRLRQQLRDIEFQAETQMSSRLEAAKAAAQSFDPLEFDRFTRFQELTRMMAESVNDVATVQRTLQRSLESAEDELSAQSRMTRDLQDDLLRTRMVEFEGLSDRLYRVVRQAAKETGKHVRLDIIGGSIEVDRGVLDRMTGSFEHLLRNCVTHGIELPDARTAAGKDPNGSIVISVSHEGNEVGVEFRDDGAGLDLARIRDKGVAMGLLDANLHHSDAELANLIFTPGFSTAEKITELAGRGVGMDVVRSEVNSMGGRIETSTAAAQGTSFKLVLPLTTAVTQVVMLRVGTATVAVPSTLVEIVRRAKPDEISQAYEMGSFEMGERALPFFWLGALLQQSARSDEPSGRTRQVVIIRSAQQRIAVHVDEVIGNQEVVVKNLGPQLSRMPGLVGMTLLASGAVALIYNPVALATLYGSGARHATQAALHLPVPDVAQPMRAEAVEAAAPLVLVVDDSLTVRRVTQRLLIREGYRVSLAKDGLDALERLAEEKPQLVLSDIEMPRMDGFDLVRNIRGDARLRDLPVIMITSRIAQKHRDYAAELGVDHYLGKPYSEEDLLALIGRYTAHAALQ